MADDIKAGDVVVCVDAGYMDPGYMPCPDLAEGRPYRVKRTMTAPQGFGDTGALAVFIVGFPYPYAAERFRKIEAPKTEIAERIIAARPIKRREPALTRADLPAAEIDIVMGSVING